MLVRNRFTQKVANIRKLSAFASPQNVLYNCLLRRVYYRMHTFGGGLCVIDSNFVYIGINLRFYMYIY